ncbi:MAG: hypothetical protein AMJ54_00440 [Deltaproteobacteria bacterium SG8_13]|nr:MAG: hypothetical protein AMJ54_00440 [Deltaproteobacteria bacterium SG8_13]
MDKKLSDRLPVFLNTLGLSEEPMGVFFADERPSEGFTPAAGELPTREKEAKNEIDWQQVFSDFSCAMGHIWRARRKKTAAYFSAEQFGCPGAAFWLGFMKPQTETIIHYVSSGVPERMKGEFYCESPDQLRNIFEMVDPPPAPGKYCIFKPLGLFGPEEEPDIVSFFLRPESLCGLHQLAAFVTNDPEVVTSPWSAACGSLVVWPRKYMALGKLKAVVGGWDPSARKFFKTDELSFSVPLEMFRRMLQRFEGSFLATETWKTVRKKIERSQKAWGEAP